VHSFDPEIHLTNDAVQKYTPLYGKYEPANKLSYVDFQKYLDSNYSKEKYNLEQQILPKMKKIALDSIKSSFVRLSPERLKHNF
jgi:tubulin monoglycylase TTLL3/8